MEDTCASTTYNVEPEEILTVIYMEESYLGDHIRMGHDNDVKSLFGLVESREPPSLQPPMELWQPRRPLVREWKIC